MHKAQDFWIAIVPAIVGGMAVFLYRTLNDEPTTLMSMLAAGLGASLGLFLSRQIFRA